MKERNLGVDCLRILSMFMIVVYHLLVHGGLLYTFPPMSVPYLSAWALTLVSCSAVDVFILIAGYVGVYSSRRFSQIAFLWLQVFVYSLSVTLFFSLFTSANITSDHFRTALFPVTRDQYWFFTKYFGLFLFMPLINRAVVSSRKREIGLYLAAILLFFSFVQAFLRSNTYGTSDGYSLIWMIVLYAVGAYVRHHGFFVKASIRKLVLSWLAFTLVTFLLKIASGRIAILGSILPPALFTSYVSPTNWFSALLLLALFSRIRIPARAGKLVSFLSTGAFSVYLVHDHPLFRKHVTADRFDFLADMPLPAFIASLLLCAAGIYLLCAAADVLRRKVFDLLRIRNALGYVDRRIKIWMEA